MSDKEVLDWFAEYLDACTNSDKQPTPLTDKSSGKEIFNSLLGPKLSEACHLVDSSEFQAKLDKWLTDECPTMQSMRAALPNRWVALQACMRLNKRLVPKAAEAKREVTLSVAILVLLEHCGRLNPKDERQQQDQDLLIDMVTEGRSRRRLCQHCNKTECRGERFWDCSCRVVTYCSRECQKADWSQHKTSCDARPPKKKKPTRNQRRRKAKKSAVTTANIRPFVPEEVD